MFRYEIKALEQAKGLVKLHHNIVTYNGESIHVNNTPDAERCYRILVVQVALQILKRPMSPTAGLLANNVYSAFAYEVEK